MLLKVVYIVYICYIASVMKDKKRKYKPYTFQSSPPDMEELRAVSEDKRTSVSSLIRQAIRDLIDNNNKDHEN